MKKIVYIVPLILLILSLFSCPFLPWEYLSSKTLEEGKYTGMLLDDVIAELGPPDYSGDDVYRNIYRMEPLLPYYYDHLTEEEINGSLPLTVRYAMWVNGRENTEVWAKETEDVWIVFCSVKYKESIWNF